MPTSFLPSLWELIKWFEVSAEHIAQRAVELPAVAKMKKSDERLQFAHQSYRLHELRYVGRS
jgi:hypothetical protein